MGMSNSDKAKVHANRVWTCPCGRQVRGNGGKSSHRKACPTWQRLIDERAERQHIEGQTR